MVFVQYDPCPCWLRSPLQFPSRYFVTDEKIVSTFDKVIPHALLLYRIPFLISIIISRITTGWFRDTAHNSLLLFKFWEYFEIQGFNDTTLYVSDINEVCGSYQCPHCLIRVPIFPTRFARLVGWSPLRVVVNILVFRS